MLPNTPHRRAWCANDTLYRLADSQVMKNPYPFSEQLQSLGPIYYDETVHAFICTTFAEGKRILQEATAFGARAVQVPDARIMDMLHRQMLLQEADSPLHSSIRATIQTHLRPRSYYEMQNTFAQWAKTLLLQLRETRREQIDLIREYASLLPTRICAALLGLPGGELSTYLQWNEAYVMLSGLPLPERTLLEYAVPKLHEALNGLLTFVSERRHWLQRNMSSEPTTLCDALLYASSDGQTPLSDEDIVAEMIVLLAGGYKSATHLIAMTLYWLQSVEQLSLTQQDPVLIAQAVRECMSYDGPSLLLARTVKQQMCLADVSLNVGDTIFVLLPAVNRDARSNEGKQTFDCLGPMVRHLGFGAGGQLCPGGSLAERYATIALEVLLSLFPSLSIDEESLQWGTLTSVRCPEQMSVRLSR